MAAAALLAESPGGHSFAVSGFVSGARSCVASSSPASVCVTPLGQGVELTWKGILAGESGAGRITAFDPDGLRLPGRLRGAARRRPRRRRAGRRGQLRPRRRPCRPRTSAGSTTSSSTASPPPTRRWRDAGWTPETEEERERTGVMIGSGIGGLATIADTAHRAAREGPAPGQPLLHPLGPDQPGLAARSRSATASRARTTRWSPPAPPAPTPSATPRG